MPPVDRYTSLQKAHQELGKTWVAYLPALLLLPVVLAPPLNHDVAANLDLTQRWIGGEALYSRLLSIDPPLIFGLNLLPAYLGKYTALGAILALQLCVLFYGVVIWWLTVRLRRHSEEGAIERHFLNVAPVLVLLGAGYDFGQREHLMVLGALPYLFLATRRVQGAQELISLCRRNSGCRRLCDKALFSLHSSICRTIFDVHAGLAFVHA